MENKGQEHLGPFKDAQNITDILNTVLCEEGHNCWMITLTRELDTNKPMFTVFCSACGSVAIQYYDDRLT